jgi:hypothetical protein
VLLWPAFRESGGDRRRVSFPTFIHDVCSKSGGGFASSIGGLTVDHQDLCLKPLSSKQGHKAGTRISRFSRSLMVGTMTEISMPTTVGDLNCSAVQSEYGS